MALFYSGCLTDQLKVTINDVHRICKASAKALKSKLEKGFSMYANSYVFEYEGESPIRWVGKLWCQASYRQQLE